jgi:hypothetical protein
MAGLHLLLACSAGGGADMTNIWCDSKECRYNRYGQCMQDVVDIVGYECDTFDPNVHYDRNKEYNARRKNEHRLPRD